MYVFSVRSLVALIIAAAGTAPLTAQDSTGRDTTRRTDTVPAVPPFLPPVPAAPAAPPATPAPPTPTLEQLRYISGLRTAARGVAQLRDGIDRVTRTQQTRDTVRQRTAGRRLGGLCTTAHSFIASGRAKMQATVYEDSIRVVAKQLVTRIDSLAKALPVCAQTAGRQPMAVATDLTNRIRGYEEALAAFRAGLATPKPDSIKTVSQQ